MRIDGNAAPDGALSDATTKKENATMPHPIPTSAVVKKTAFDGALTGSMNQGRAESYLSNIVIQAGHKDCLADLKQSLNQMFGGSGKSTGSYTYAGRAVFHASSGNGQKSVTLFYYLDAACAVIFAMGEHVDAKSGTAYQVTYFGPAGTLFAVGRKIALR